MHSRTLRASNGICLRCQWRLASQNQIVARFQNSYNVVSVTESPRTLSARTFHTSTPVCLVTANTVTRNTDTYQRAQSLVTPTPIDPTVDPVFVARPPHLPIRNHLAKWQVQYGGPSEETLSAFEKHPANGEMYNNVSKVTGASAADDQTEGDRWFAGEEDDGEDLITIGLFLKPGDVVELS